DAQHVRQPRVRAEGTAGGGARLRAERRAGGGDRRGHRGRVRGRHLPEPGRVEEALSYPGAETAAHAARERDSFGAGARGVEQADRARPGLERAHGGGAPAEHQAATGHRGAGGADQVRRGACAEVWAELIDRPIAVASRIPAPFENFWAEVFLAQGWFSLQ